MADTFEQSDAAYITKALGVISRAKVKTEINSQKKPDFPVSSFIAPLVSAAIQA